MAMRVQRRTAWFAVVLALLAGLLTATDCAAWERAVTDGGWSADYRVDEARKLGASYIVLATFHSRLGYARPWPSKIPGSCATRRDLLGELVKAGNAKGVRTILYMTDDPQWHKETGVESLDSAAYSAYKGKRVDLTTRPRPGGTPCTSTSPSTARGPTSSRSTAARRSR